MTRDEALKLFNEKGWIWHPAKVNSRNYYVFSRIASALELERRKTQEDFFYFQSIRKLSDRSKLYGLWIQDELQKLLANHPNCHCLNVEMPDKVSTQPTGPEDKSLEAHIAKVGIGSDQDINTTSKESLKNALTGLDAFIRSMRQRDVESEVQRFNAGVDIDSYAQDRLNYKSHVGKTYNKVSPTAQQGNGGTAGNDISPLTNRPRNLIYFGAPGTGKSFQLKVAVEGKTDKDGKIKQIIDDDIDKCEGVFITLKDGEVDERRYERVTFYPTYSYAQFVGCYKPVMEKPADGGKEEIAYRFVPGPFLRVLVNALKAFPPKLDEMSLSQLQDYVRKLRDSDREAKDKLHISESNGKPSGEWKNTAKLIEMLKEYYKNKKHCLVIEEINRANAAAVFGDVFQLLDRQGNGESEYDVAASKDVKRYLKKELAKDEYKCAREFLGVESNGIIELDEEGEWRNCRLRIPSNMYIWATMNSADQGVFPMDTAFKRRWEFKYFGINEGEKDCADWTIEGANYNWNDVRKIVNGLLSRHGVNEDKLMGAHFVSAMAKKVSSEAFKSKVLMYLWEDAARMCRRQMFGSIDTFSGLLKNWAGSGVKVFEKDAELKNLENDDETKEAYKMLFKPAETQDSQPESGSEPGSTGSPGAQ